MFNENDTICFLGDSITALSLWINEIYDFFKDNMPEKKIKIFNCGCSGDHAYKGNLRLNYDCLEHSPKYVSIMFGINDIGRSKYSPNYNQPDKEEKIAESMATFKEQYELLITRILKSGATPILCTIVPYDEVSKNGDENLMCGKGVIEVCDFVKEMGKKYGLKVVDFYNAFLPYLGKEGIMRSDRVHPEEKGFHIMARTWLKEMGLVENLDIDKEYVMSDKVKNWYEKCTVLRDLRFVEYYNIREELEKPLSKRYEKVKKMLSEKDNEWQYQVLNDYLKNAEFEFKLKDDIIEAMNEIYA